MAGVKVYPSIPAAPQQEVAVIKNERARVWVNRVLAFLAGGVVVLIIMSVAAVAPVRSQVETLTKQLDEAQHGAARLLSEAKALVASKDYERALSTLETLLDKQPGSSEATEGRKLHAEIQTMIRERDQRWEAAVGKVREAWVKAAATELRAQSEKDRAELETNMNATLDKEWEKIKDQIRSEWEKQK
jgi:hypothetical protein